jgi:lysophospholipase L1-like esterase
MSIKNDRRDFIKHVTLTGMASAIMPVIFAASQATKKISLGAGSTILFQGDSITDAGRKRDIKEGGNTAALGNGYAFLATAKLLEQHADKQLKIYNRGISGNKVYQLAERWEEDCISLKPDIVSILIGVNDFWHMIDGKYNGTMEKYAADFEALLTRTKAVLPAIKFIIGEPFAVPGVKAVTEKWYPEFDAYRNVAKIIATRFDTVFIPYQTVFDKAQKKAPATYWTGDGVHPTLAGSELMAEAWLNTIKR